MTATQKKHTGAAELLLRFYEHNDEEALSAFFLQFKDLAFRIAYNVLGNIADAEDITQQTFVQILKKQAICKAAYDENDLKVKSWLLTIIYNASRMQYNAKKKNQTLELNEVSEVESQKNSQINESAENASLLKKVNHAIFDLPEKYRVPILMRYHQDMTIEEISTTLSSQPNTIRSILSRGVNLLRNKLSHENNMLSATAVIELVALVNYPLPKHIFTLESIKNVNISNSYVSKAIAHQTSNWFMKFAIVFTSVATIATSIFIFKYGQTEPEATIPTTTKTQSPKIEVVSSKKMKWDFSKESGSDIDTIQSQLIFDDKYKALVNKVEPGKINASALSEIPYLIDKPVKISVYATLEPNRGQYEKEYFNSLEFIPIQNKSPILGKMIYHYIRAFTIPSDKSNWRFEYDHYFYVFDNYCVTVIDENTILKIHEYDRHIINNYIGIINANFFMKKIQIEEVSPEELQKIKLQSQKIIENINK